MGNVSRSQPLGLGVDRSRKVPAYRQIADQVRLLVAAGGAAPGAQLPTVRRVADEVGVHFNTVARAYRLLDRLGLISAQRGRGTYVVRRSVAGRHGRRQDLAALSRELVANAVRLGFTPQETRAALEKALARWAVKGRRAQKPTPYPSLRSE